MVYFLDRMYIGQDCLLFFDTTVAYTAAVLQVKELCGKHAGDKVCAAIDASQFVYRLECYKGPGRERNSEGEIHEFRF